MSTFRSVVKPNKKLVSTDISGTLDFEDKYNAIEFSAAQSANITTLDNILHLIDGQTVMIQNTGSNDVIIDASLMEEGLPVDIEQDTTTLLFFMKSIGKFKDLGGTARIRDLEIDYAAHDHDGSNSNRILATDLDDGGASDYEFLRSTGASQPSWHSIPGYHNGRFRSVNTNTTTNLTGSSTAWAVEIPLLGNVTRIDSDFTVVGNAVRCNFNGRIKLSSSIRTYNTAIEAVDIRFAKNGTTFGPIGTSSHLGWWGVDYGSASITDEIDVSVNDLITVRSRRASGSTTITLAESGGSNLIIERVE